MRGPKFAVDTAFTLTVGIPTTLPRNVLIGPLAAGSRLAMTRTAVGVLFVAVKVLVEKFQVPNAISAALIVIGTPAAKLAYPVD
mgnify:CR=1 FL=1